MEIKPAGTRWKKCPSFFKTVHVNNYFKVAKEAPQQCAKTLYNLLGHISKDQTVQYLLTLVDDFLQEDKARVAIFRWDAAIWKLNLNLN